MSPTFELIATGGFGIVAGTLSGFLGIGGGAVLPPMLVLVLGIEQHRAQGISLAALVPPVGLPAVLAYRASGVRVAWALVAALIGGFVVGGLGGAWLAHRVPSRQLGWCFAAFLLLSAFRAVRAKDASDAPSSALSRARVASGVPIGALAGLMSGLLGVGGGLVALPLLRRFVRLGRLEAQATTLAMLLPPIGLPAVYIYAKEQGGLPWGLLAAVGAGFALGAAFGARLAGRVNARRAALVYAVFLGLMAVVLVTRG
jgi:uncharacterized membrane protein YfcA